MEVMEEGNLMDRVRILLQRDMAYYQERQSVLHETLCSGVVGGLLDFPHYASFAAYKLALWWEEEYQAAFRKPSGLFEQESDRQEVAASDTSLERGCGGVAKTSAPKEFVQLTAESGEQILEHLHALSQEALDHADLTVLAATLGAAALLRSCLWCYHQLLVKARQDGLSLHVSQKQFHSMAEALAERLLDLHCRLLSLYVLQDADSLHWENTRPFFEGERGSVTVQMWWLYMQGTRTDLWNTVPPRTAQRVFAGMLNESLTILAARYATAQSSAARAPLLVTDLINMLLCVRELAVSVCADAAELVGLTQRSKIIRDVHAKCHELLTTLLLRGCPLDTLFRAFRNKGVAGVEVFAAQTAARPAPWVQLVSPQYFRGQPRSYQDLEDGSAISLELSVLLAQPQPSWALLLRLLMMRNCRLATLILRRLIVEEGAEATPLDAQPASSGAAPAPADGVDAAAAGCGRFLCRGDCARDCGQVSMAKVEQALVHVIATVGGGKALGVTLMPALDATSARGWGAALDRRQVWNQRRPPWMDALITPLRPMLQATVDTIIAAVQAGAPCRDLVPLALSCLTQLAPCLPPWLGATASALAEQLPADVHPAGGSPLLQLVLAGLYAALMAAAARGPAHGPARVPSPAAAEMIGELAEALCRLDEDAALLPTIQEFLRAVHEYTEDVTWDWQAVEESLTTAELLVSKILLTNDGRQALKVMYQFVQQNASWTLSAIGRVGDYLVVPPRSLLHTMFHIGNRQFDQYLAGSWSLDWSTLIRSPLGLSQERVWQQLQKRPEFIDYKSDPQQLSQHDTIVVQKMTEMFTEERNSSGNWASESCQMDSTHTPHNTSTSHSRSNTSDVSKSRATNRKKAPNVNLNHSQHSVVQSETNIKKSTHTENEIEEPRLTSKNKPHSAINEKRNAEDLGNHREESRVPELLKPSLESSTKNTSTPANMEVSASVHKKPSKEQSTKTSKVKEKGTKD